MAISNPKASSNPKKTGANSAKDTLDWRIKELRAFDVSRILDRWDPVLESLHKSVNDSLAEVLGNNSPDYRKFAIETFDATLPSDFGGRYSTEELQRAVQESVAQAIVTLDRVKALIRERSRQQPPSSATPPAPVATPAPVAAAPAAVTPAAVTPKPVAAPAAPTPPAAAPARAVAAPPPAPAVVKTTPPPVSAAPVAASTPVPAPPAVTPPPPAAATPAPAAIKPAVAPAAPVQPAPAAPSAVTVPPSAPAQAPVPAAASPSRVRVAVLGGEAQARRAVLVVVQPQRRQPAITPTPPPTEHFLDRLDELRDLQYAVVLLPAQSLDPSSGAPTAVAPALLMELGHVLATVGRSHVCFLLSGAGKPPAWQGISNLRLDDEGLWHLLLARAMKQAGLDVDLNRAV